MTTGGWKPPKWARQASAKANENKAAAEAKVNDQQQWTAVVGQPAPAVRQAPFPRLNKMSRYSIPQALARLEKEGFDRRVTVMSFEGCLVAWLPIHDHYTKARPFREPGEYIPPLGHTKKSATMASLVLGPQVANAAYNRIIASATCGEKGLSGLLKVHDIREVWEEIFAQGLKAAQSLAQASPQIWARLCSNVMVWNSVECGYHFEGKSGVFVAVTPEYTVGDVLGARDLDPHGKQPWNVCVNWWKDVITEENDLVKALVEAKDHLIEDHTPAMRSAIATQVGDKATTILQHLRQDHQFWCHRQFSAGSNTERIQFSQFRQGQQLQQLVKEIWKKHSTVKVLHLEKIALLDRRLLAVILRGCPKVTMLGVYNCELLHFGDVVALLDLIGEVNSQRREQGHLEIKALDFGPNFEAGMPLRGDGAETYGLTFQPISRDLSQRGFFAIIMKAFLKAHSLGIGMLFDEGCAFRDFLNRVPTMAFGVPMFLDALYRLLDLNGGNLPHHKLKRQQAIYDLRIAIRMPGGDDFHKDTDEWYANGMLNKRFCTSCGYEMLEEFFTYYGLEMTRLTTHYCAACGICDELDKLTNRVMVEKRACLNKLFPHNDPKSFNLDAEIPKGGECIISLKSTNAEGPPPGAIQEIPYHRDKKLHFDGLSDLPSLKDLATSDRGTWEDFRIKLSHLDAYCLAARIFEYQQTEEENEAQREKAAQDENVDQPKTAAQRKRDAQRRQNVQRQVKEGIGYDVMGNGPPNHHRERQNLRTGQIKVSSATFGDILFIHLEWVKKGIIPGGGGGVTQLLGKERAEAHQVAWEKDFW